MNKYFVLIFVVVLLLLTFMMFGHHLGFNHYSDNMPHSLMHGNEQ